MGAKLWWVKIPTGEEFGPINSESLNRLIDKGILNESDLLGEDPNKFWMALTHTPFYDRFVESLGVSQSHVSSDFKVEELQKSVSFTVASRRKTTSEIESPKTPPPPKEKKKPGTAKATPAKKQEIEAPPKSTPPPKPRPEVIELKENKKPKVQIVPFVLLALAFSSAVYILMPQSDKATAEPIRLLSPGPNINKISSEEIEKTFKKVLSAFESDTVQGYVWSMNELVRVLESQQKRVDAYGLLCLTYRELWPFSYQDQTDKLRLQEVMKLVAQVDPTGIDAATCRVSLHLIDGRTRESTGIIDSVLNEKPTAAVFYEFKSETLARENDYNSAIAYVQKTQQLWPSWVKSFVSEAELRMKLGDISIAANLLREKNRRNPKHAKIGALLGQLEWSAFKHPDQAQELLLSALTGGERLIPMVEAPSAYALAQVYDSKKETTQALAWAQRAYALDSSLVGLSDLLKALGGEKSLGTISRTDRELMALGEQFVLGQNHLAAQAQFKSAFEMNPKNAMAALKAGKSLWALNQSQEAIAWINRSIQSDPTLTEAYVLLGDYYSQRFDFISASGILQKAQRASPKRYEVFYGFAILEFRRNNFKGAITSAKRALELYNTDLPTMILLAKSYKESGEIQEGYSWISHAIELDKGNAEAQSLYAEILTDVQGSSAGIDYIRKLSDTYPNIHIYKVNLARILKKEGKVAEAIEILKTVTSVDSKNKQALLLQGEYSQQLGRLDESLASFLAAASLDPSDAAPLFSAGNLYLQFNKPLPAISQFERVLLINPNFPRAHYSLGRAALLMGQRQRAINEAQAEKRLNPNLADAYLLAGDIHTEEKQYSRATVEYQSALKLRPQGAEVYIKLARAYRLSGQFDVAASMLRIAEAKESGNAEIFKEFGAVYEMKGDNVLATKFYNRYLQILPNAIDRSAISDRIKNIGGIPE